MNNQDVSVERFFQVSSVNLHLVGTVILNYNTHVQKQ